MIYFDNAATTFPKPGRVQRAVRSAMEVYGANPGRSGHSLSMATAVKVYECREKAAAMFGTQVENVIFCCNCTHAINTAIKGALRYGDHVIISDLEHNSVLRPVHALAEQGAVSYSVAKVGADDRETIAAFEAAVTPRTRLIACTHASNVFGIRLPIEQISGIAKRYGLLFLVDAAQTAGVLPVDINDCGADFLCTAGHKSLYGPAGTGLLVTPHGPSLATLMEGGTGSFSADYDMPEIMPDRFECGTLNTAGILGLSAGLDFVAERGIKRLHAAEMKLGRQIFDCLKRCRGVRLYTDEFDPDKNVPVISFNIEDMSSEDVTGRLSDKGFALRGGLHCAPLAHKKMGTLETGAVRISIGAFNTPEQGERLCAAIRRVARSGAVSTG